jgi:methyltransferase
MIALIVLVLAFLPMLFEARLSSQHERALRSAAAFEPKDDVIGWMRIAYPAAFIVMALEAALRHPALNASFAVGLVVFVAGKAVKYWAIATLGPRWTFRVLVPPTSSLVTHGPYRYMRHPNYLGVIGELLGIAITARAILTGALSVALFAVLIVLRIRVEERALDRARSN